MARRSKSTNIPTRSDNYGVLLHDPDDRGDRRDRCARRRGAARGAAREGLDAHPHPHHAPSSRPHRRQHHRQAHDRLHHRRPGQGGRLHSRHRCRGQGGRHGRDRQRQGARDRDAGPYQGPRQLLFPRRRARVRRRHAVLGRLRQAARGRRQDDVGLAEEARAACRPRPSSIAATNIPTTIAASR